MAYIVLLHYYWLKKTCVDPAGVLYALSGGIVARYAVGYEAPIRHILQPIGARTKSIECCSHGSKVFLSAAQGTDDSYGMLII